MKNSGSGLTDFSSFDLTAPVLKSLERMNYVTPTDVQAKTIPLVLEGRDVLVTAQTGTGKTAAFAVPIFQRMIEAVDADQPIRRTLVLAPTRELAEQIGAVLRELMFFYRRLRYAVVIGGAPYGKQFRELGLEPAFVVGTPGRIIDHIETGTLKLEDFDTLVLDESDRMLDMGFAPQIEMIVSRFPPVRQTMMFSATLPTEVRGLVSRYLRQPARVAIGEENRAVDKIQQDVIELDESEKTPRLIHEINGMAGTIIVFVKTRLKADVVASMLADAGHKAEALHGDMNQSARRKVTTKFRDGTVRILVATDIAARGLDIDHIKHVINFDLPMVPEDYVHRIGRTGRMGRDGHSLAFVTQHEKARWNAILRVMGLGGGAKQGHGQRGYKNAKTRAAFSGNSVGNARNKPFAKPFAGMSNEKPRLEKSFFDSRAPMRENGKAPREGKSKKFTAPEGQAVRDDFDQRASFAESSRARELGRRPRFGSETLAQSKRDERGGERPARKERLTDDGKPIFRKGKPDSRGYKGQAASNHPGAKPVKTRSGDGSFAPRDQFGNKLEVKGAFGNSMRPKAKPGSRPAPKKGSKPGPSGAKPAAKFGRSSAGKPGAARPTKRGGSSGNKNAAAKRGMR